MVLGEEEDGWLRGQVGDKTGVFPSNFVEIITEETPSSITSGLSSTIVPVPSPRTTNIQPPPSDRSSKLLMFVTLAQSFGIWGAICIKIS